MPSSRPAERRGFFSWRFIRPERRRSTRRWAIVLLALIPLFFLTERYVVGTGIVTDVSMLPTLPEGRYFLVLKFPFRLRPPQRGEIVVFRSPKNPRWRYIKRVIAVEEDVVQIAGGILRLNGRPLREPYVRGATGPEGGPLTVPKGHLFLLGDNRLNSEDSRQFGAVPVNRVEGKVNP